MKKALSFFINFLASLGYILITVLLMSAVSFFIISYKISKEEIENPYCNLENQDLSLDIFFDEITLYTYEIKCNTMYVNLFFNDNINKEAAVSVLLTLQNQLKENNIQINTQVTCEGSGLSKPLFASLNIKNDGITYIGG